MGCDIHMYVEHARKREPDDARPTYWFGFGGRVNPGRNYMLFSLLAGVRGSFDPVFAPRGVPSNLAREARDDFYLHIIEDGEEREPGENQCTRSDAARWSKYSRLFRRNRDADSAEGMYVPVDNVAEAEICEHPDWHTPSWLTVDEFKQVLERYMRELPALIEEEDLELEESWRSMGFDDEKRVALRERVGAAKPAFERALGYIHEYRALLAAMLVLAETDDVRVVFWFDN